MYEKLWLSKSWCCFDIVFERVSYVLMHALSACVWHCEVYCMMQCGQWKLNLLKQCAERNVFGVLLLEFCLVLYIPSTLAHPSLLPLPTAHAVPPTAPYCSPSVSNGHNSDYICEQAKFLGRQLISRQRKYLSYDILYSLLGSPEGCQHNWTEHKINRRPLKQYFFCLLFFYVLRCVCVCNKK